jgi:glycosidase
MAVDTPKSYRNQVMYSVYVRNHTPEGTFQALRADLPRIRDLGVDIIWLMPIHPIGKKARKGTLGSPYAISDYRAVNPEYGTMEDFRALVEDIHGLGMKCIIDVVYNHTSPDSWLVENHPEWFYHKADGSFGNHVGDWSDIVDLDYTQTDLWDYQIETLKMWAGIVDGFRCDVAPMVPLRFWLKARAEVEKVHPGCFWLSESIEPEFIRYLRGQGLVAHSDAEIFQAFDVAYDYDIFGIFRGYLQGKLPLSAYADAVTRQESMYPENYVKLRYLENHDVARAAQIIPDEKARQNWTAFQYFQKGLTMLYGGQEVDAVHRPGLFDKDDVNWSSGHNQSNLLRRLAELKKEPLLAVGSYCVTALPRDILLAVYEKDGQKLMGVFSVRGEASLVEVGLPDGQYENLISGDMVDVYGGCLGTNGTPVVIRA